MNTILRASFLLLLFFLPLQVAAATLDEVGAIGAPPSITSIFPASGAAGTLVTINGTDLNAPTSITIGGTVALVINNTGTVLTAMVMPGAITGNVSITTVDGSATSGSNFTVTPSLYPAVQQGNKLVATGGSGNGFQGSSVAVSADGNTAVVGASEDSGNAGNIYIYTRSGTTWSQQAKLQGTGFVGQASQGRSVATSADGNTILVGAYNDDSGKGAVWVFIRNGTTWSQQGSKLIGTGVTGVINAFQGWSVAISADGNTALWGGKTDNSQHGSAWVFARTAGVWSQQGNKLEVTDNIGQEALGMSVALSADGNTALLGGPYDNSQKGATWVFKRASGTWSQQAKLIGAGTSGIVEQGYSVALSADGNTAAVGADQNGSAWIYTYNGNTWSQQGNKLVGTGNVGSSKQGLSIAISADGNTIITGGNADNNNNGAAWVFTRNGSTWSQKGNKLAGTGNSGAAQQGFSVALSADGATALVGGPFDIPINQQGAVWVYTALSTDATLSALAIGTGTLNPTFASTTNTYNAAVASTTNSITVTPTVNNTKATVTVNGTTVASGSASTAIALATGANTISVIVTAQDGTTTNTYTITITRGVYYSKPSGDLSLLSTYGTSTDGSGTAPADFNGSNTNAIYQLANRASYTLTSNLSIGTVLNIPAAATLDIAGNKLTVNALSGTGTLTGSNTSSLIVNGSITNLAFTSTKEQLGNLTLGNAASITLTSALNIASTGSVTLGTNATLNTGGFLTLKSTSAGTAFISTLGTGATINGNATVERYLYDKRAWRLISSPVYSTQTINTAWQEGAGGTNADPKPGYGTLIIGSSTANGFDIAGTSASLLVYNGNIFNNAANTNTLTLSSNPAYFLFSIGSRSVNPATAGAHSSTILRSNGTLITGTQTASINASGYTLVGNPYAAPVDFSQVTRSSSVPNQFYAWDINLGAYGGYVLVTNTGGNNYTSIPFSPSGLNNIIPSGGAILVQSDGINTGTLTVNESCKASAAGNGTFANFSTPAITNIHNIRVNLSDGNSNLIDGVMASFAAGNSNKVDAEDALKLSNFYENISLVRSDKLLTLERRSELNTKDTVFIQLSGVKKNSYHLQIDPIDLNEPGMTAYLEDAYLHTQNKLDLSQVNSVSFNTNADSASYKNRFQITFIPEVTNTVMKIAHIGASVIAYPNPVTQKKISLSFDGMPAGIYNISVTNTFGRIMQRDRMVYNGSNTGKILAIDYSPGIYTINIQSAGYNQAIKVIIP